ncbi:hypothetical protein ACFS3C_24975 [Azotobacter vinelandii]
MTLVVVGHEFEKKQLFFHGEKILETHTAGMKPVGLFAVADSSITAPNSNGKQTILGGFRKNLPCRNKKFGNPSSTASIFRSYLEVHYEAECFVAIAGSTFTAQHVLNLISEHLRKKFALVMKEQKNYSRPESMFL